MSDDEFSGKIIKGSLLVGCVLFPPFIILVIIGHLLTRDKGQ